MNRTLLATVAVLSLASCTEDLAPITKTWTETLATIQGQLSEFTRNAAELRARASQLNPAADDATGTELKGKLDGALGAVDKSLADVQALIGTGTSSVNEAITKGKIAGVQTAIDKVKADVSGSLDKVKPQLKSIEELLGEVTKHFAGLEEKKKAAAAAAVAEAPPSVDATQAGEADYDSLDFKDGTDALLLEKASTKASLDALISLMNSCKEIVVEVEGHTSKVGDAKKNKELSAKRAQAVTRHLINEGKVSPSKIKKTYGYGSEKPAMEEPEPGSDAEKAMEAAKLSAVRARNERIHLRILKPCPASK